MNRPEFIKAIALVIAAVGKPMPDEMVAAWYLLLRELTAEQLERGIVETLRTHQYAGFPPVGTICVNSIGGAGRVVNLETRAVVAWDRVLTAIRVQGGYRSVEFDDPVIHATVRNLGGWVQLTDATSEDLSRFIQPRFIKTYSALAQMGITEAEAAPLFGLIDTDNTKAGYELGEVVAIATGLPRLDVKIIPSGLAPKGLPTSGIVKHLADAMRLTNDREPASRSEVAADISTLAGQRLTA